MPEPTEKPPSFFWRDSIGLALVRVVLQAGLFFAGFEVFSTDDYLRLWGVVDLAQHWRWLPDPVFLPAYFWVYALPIKLGFPPVGSALALTMLLAGTSTALFYSIARNLGARRLMAIVATLFFSTQPMAIFLGGVPLSETLSLTLVLAAVAFWFSSFPSARIGASLAVAAATLVRFENWPLAAGFLLALWMNGERRSLRFGRALLSIAGILWYLSQRLFEPGFLEPFRFSGEMSMHRAGPWAMAGVKLTGWLALCPSSWAFLVAGLSRATRSAPLGRLLFLLLFFSTALLLAPLAGFGYYPGTFTARTVFHPNAFLLLLTVAGAERWLESISKPALSLLFSALIVMNGIFLSHPPYEVSPETRQAGKVLRLTLKHLPPTAKVLVHRNDPGWSALWGLARGDARIVFDRPLAGPWKRRDPDPRSFVEALRTTPELACTLSASTYARAAVESDSSRWQLTWSEGKYALFCLRVRAIHVKMEYSVRRGFSKKLLQAEKNSRFSEVSPVVGTASAKLKGEKHVCST